ncbi:hypothetical protein EB796_025057 [Bugula neritina]|uniref:Secreted protein n=1 Tax=Bugula neritina TaxID=10212 RepID=A0A7J7ITT7_BUGNE|nr:hypothetical protein EB796_025057 [Bugula neritina]
MNLSLQYGLTLVLLQATFLCQQGLHRFKVRGGKGIRLLNLKFSIVFRLMFFNSSQNTSVMVTHQFYLFFELL